MVLAPGVHDLLCGEGSGVALVQADMEVAEVLAGRSGGTAADSVGADVAAKRDSDGFGHWDFLSR